MCFWRVISYKSSLRQPSVQEHSTGELMTEEPSASKGPTEPVLQITFPQQPPSRLIVEAGHIYMHETPGLDHHLSATWGSLIAHYLTLWGAEIEKWVFVDNYNPRLEGKPELLNWSEYYKLLQEWGFTPDKTQFEGNLVSAASGLFEQLQKKGKVEQHPSGVFMLSKGKVLLYHPAAGYPDGNKYMCSLLDACLYLEKLAKADGCVTVLSDQYRAQQKGTLTILKELGEDTSRIFPFFYAAPSSPAYRSVAPQQVFAEGYDPDQPPLGFVRPALDLLKGLQSLSGTVQLGPSLEWRL